MTDHASDHGASALPGHHHHHQCCGHASHGVCAHNSDQHDACLGHHAHGEENKVRPAATGQRPPIKVDFDTQEWTELMAILEEMDDQTQACAFLNELNEKSAAWGKLFMNLTPDLESKAWKEKCDTAQQELLAVIAKIKSFA